MPKKTAAVATKREEQHIGTERGVLQLGGRLAKKRPTKKVKAVLFVAEGTDIDPNLEIQVVGIDPAGMQAIVARRC